jgi:hypothetical protein
MNTQKVVTGLNSYTYTIPTTGQYQVRMNISDDERSALTGTISQSGSVSLTIVTGTEVPPPVNNTTGQSDIILQGSASCVAGDVITFAITSSSAIDQQPNTVKAKISVAQVA